jgi:hypothetical protein
VAETLNVDRETVREILMLDFGMREVSERMVYKMLTTRSHQLLDA